VNYWTSHLNHGKAASALIPGDQHPSNLLTQEPLILGLMAEQVVETLNRSEADLIDTKIRVESAPYLGKVLLDEQGMIQCIQIEDLLTEEQQSLLFAGGNAVHS
jgi:chemotaxis signal transduction protein